MNEKLVNIYGLYDAGLINITEMIEKIMEIGFTEDEAKMLISKST